jgi:hypothetical protein
VVAEAFEEGPGGVGQDAGDDDGGKTAQLRPNTLSPHDNPRPGTQ